MRREAHAATADSHIRFGSDACAVLVVHVLVSGLRTLDAFDATQNVALSATRRALALIQDLPSVSKSEQMLKKKKPCGDM